MGRPKALLTMGTHGPTFLDAIEKTLRASGLFEWRVVVSPELAHRVAQGVVNPDPSLGMLSSVQRGLRTFGNDLDAALVWPVDHPLVARETIVGMVAAFRSGNAPVVVPTYEGRRGHPVLFAARLFPELLAADPSRGARAVVHAHGDRVELAVADPGVTLDIDTPADYERMFGAPIASQPEVP
jgi:molybdenum cofactor cytidylyltransferase